LNFIDQATIHVRGGNGGNGCMAFRREKFVPYGGPSGGDGGDGGAVYLIGERNRNTLYHLQFQSLYPADRGRHGEGSNRFGRSGDDLDVPVPLGTVVFDKETGEQIGEVLEDGQRLLVATGGRGGRGNARFATSTNQAPRRADPGIAGEERTLRLELKLLADVGVVGLPNAGKSTLISVISAARPKIADYPFTTLVPQLGVVAEGPFEKPFVIADLPGLIAGAAQGAGLGIQFLRHVERCRVLVHLVDLSGLEEGSSAREDLETVEREMEAFNADLMRRPRFLIGSKLDSALPERREELRQAAEERGIPYREISAATNEGLRPLVGELARTLAEVDAEANQAAADAARAPYSAPPPDLEDREDPDDQDDLDDPDDGESAPT
jgi:GTP-binding protein